MASTGALEDEDWESASGCDDRTDNVPVTRHSGRALIRGKIRRIWRPRYLELLSNGHVRYFECGSSEETDRIHMVPKCALKVYRSRIIDVTTLRDVHVGLPQGSYGFLFHAKRTVHIQDDHCYLTGETTITPRDFLCAVPTLEQAQTWVVALNWASQLQLETPRALHRVAPNTLNEQPSPKRITTSNKNDALLLLSQKTKPNKTQTKPSAINGRNTTRQEGKIVVAKVQQTQFIRTSRLLHFDLAYRIDMLIVASRTGTALEVRALLRTRSQWHQLLQQLLEGNTTKANPMLESLQHRFRAEPQPRTYKDYIQSIPLIDSIVKTITMDGSICNSAPLRKFWGLTSDDVVIVPRPFWQIHQPNSVLLQWTHQLATGSIEGFVKDWLQQGAYEQLSSRKQLLWNILHLNSTWLASFLVLPWVVLKLYQKIHGLVGELSVPVDLLILTHVLSVLLGRQLERQYGTVVSKQIRIGAANRTISESDDSELLDVESTSTEGDMVADDFVGDPDSADKPRGSPSEQSLSSLSSPLPQYPANRGISCWSKPQDSIFRVRSATYLQNRIKLPSAPAPFVCRGVDVWLTDNPERHIARHPAVIGGKLHDEDTFLVNFLLPFGNFVSYFSVPPLDKFPKKLAGVWTKFLNGDQQYRDARLKLLPVVVDGPWIVKAAVGSSSSPALLGKVIPLQYYFDRPADGKKGIYEVDVIITASSIAKGILSVVKGHTKSLTIAFGFIIEASKEEELPETVISSFQMHSIDLAECPQLPELDLDRIKT